MPQDALDFQVGVFKALAHPTRLGIVKMLAREGPKCVCELVERFGFDQSTVSKHLSLLRSAGIVASTKEGLNVIYRLNMECIYWVVSCVEAASAGDIRGHPACMRFGAPGNTTVATRK